MVSPRPLRACVDAGQMLLVPADDVEGCVAVPPLFAVRRGSGAAGVRAGEIKRLKRGWSSRCAWTSVRSDGRREGPRGPPPARCWCVYPRDVNFQSLSAIKGGTHPRPVFFAAFPTSPLLPHHHHLSRTQPRSPSHAESSTQWLVVLLQPAPASGRTPPRTSSPASSWSPSLPLPVSSSVTTPAPSLVSPR